MPNSQASSEISLRVNAMYGVPVMLVLCILCWKKTYVTGIQQNVVLNVSACSNNIAFCHDLSFWVLVWLVQLMITLWPCSVIFFLVLGNGLTYWSVWKISGNNDYRYVNPLQFIFIGQFTLDALLSLYACSLALVCLISGTSIHLVSFFWE